MAYINAQDFITMEDGDAWEPLDRVIKEGVGVFCKRCGSTKSRTWMFGSRKCDNPKWFGDRDFKIDQILG